MISTWLYNGSHYNYGVSEQSMDIESFFPLSPLRKVSRRTYEKFKSEHRVKAEKDVMVWSAECGFQSIVEEYKANEAEVNAKKLAAG